MTPGLAHCLAILKALGIGEVVYSLSGGGDEGSCGLDSLTYLGWSHKTPRCPRITIGTNDLGQPHHSSTSFSKSIVAEIPDGDWSQ